MNERMRDHFLAVTGEKAVRTVAAKSGIDQSTLNRQLTGESTLTIETVVALCRTFKLKFAPAFIAAGFITSTEAAEFGVEEALTHATDRQLVTEMLRRVDQAETGSMLTEPLSQAVIDGMEP